MTQIQAARPARLLRRRSIGSTSPSGGGQRTGPGGRGGGRLARAGLFTPTGYLAAATLLLLTFLVVAGPGLWGEQANTLDVESARLGPSWEHPFGTDNTGRDVLARVLAAGRLSIGLAVATALLGAVVGVTLGAINGVLGPRARRLLAEVINLLLAFPGILVALFLTAIMGPGLVSAVVALSVASAPAFARLAQTLTASLANADFVAAAKLAGFSRRRILTRHVLPNVAEPLVLTTASAAGSSLLAFASLSFLGLGIQPPNYDWGRVLSEGLERLYVSPAAAVGPAVVIVVTGMSFNLVGDLLARLVATPATATPLPAANPSTGVEDDVVGAPQSQRTTEIHGDAVASAGDSDRERSSNHHSVPVLEVRGLSVRFAGTAVVDDVDLVIEAGERVAIVGESGSGKTMMALASSLLPTAGAHVESTIHRFDGVEAADVSSTQLGTRMALVFQDPLSSWNPALRIGTQMTEATRVHGRTTKADALSRAEELLNSVRITAPASRLGQYPHQLSGGMRQRAAIASALMTSPRLLIADEPTTALDVTVQAQVLAVLRQAAHESGAALMLITHDLGVVGELCDRVLVMYAGRIVEDAPLASLTSAAAHPYARALLRTMPDLQTDVDAPLPSIPGQQPEPAARPSGCAFRDRCPRASRRCAEQQPPLVQHAPGHRVACWHPVPADALNDEQPELPGDTTDAADADLGARTDASAKTGLIDQPQVGGAPPADPPADSPAESILASRTPSRRNPPALCAAEPRPTTTGRD